MEISLEMEVSHVNFKLSVSEAEKLIEILDDSTPLGVDVMFVASLIRMYHDLTSKV